VRKSPGPRAPGPHDIVPRWTRREAGDGPRTLSPAVGHSWGRARLSRGEKSSGGIRRHERHGLTRRTRVGSDRGGRTDEEEGGMFVVEPTESEDEHRKEAGGMWMTRLMPVAVNPTEGGST
jgi:hypothetical protein